MQANGFADILAKEAAMEVKELGEEISVMTVQGVKRHTRVNIRQVEAKIALWGVQARVLPLQTLLTLLEK